MKVRSMRDVFMWEYCNPPVTGRTKEVMDFLFFSTHESNTIHEYSFPIEEEWKEEWMDFVTPISVQSHIEVSGYLAGALPSELE